MAKTEYQRKDVRREFIRSDRSMTLCNEQVRPCPKEYDLLTVLARSAGQVVTHKRLLAAGWGQEATDTQYLRVYTGLLRQKIEEDPSDPRLLLTEPGVGSRLVAAGRLLRNRLALR